MYCATCYDCTWKSVPDVHYTPEEKLCDLICVEWLAGNFAVAISGFSSLVSFKIIVRAKRLSLPPMTGREEEAVRRKGGIAKDLQIDKIHRNKNETIKGE